jgi:hypothetical protein
VGVIPRLFLVCNHDQFFRQVFSLHTGRSECLHHLQLDLRHIELLLSDPFEYRHHRQLGSLSSKAQEQRELWHALAHWHGEVCPSGAFSRQDFDLTSLGHGIRTLQ